MPFIFLLVLSFLASCALDDTSRPTGVLFENDIEHEGMMKIGAKGHSVLLGTNDPSAATIDRPQMKVTFTYNYSISKTELTNQEHADIWQHPLHPSLAPNVPRTNVTYFDAVLLANARSKAEAYDTAYTYISVIYNEAGNCTYLGGLRFDPSKEAYRLPTEAEWVFAAQKDWNPYKAWSNANSDFVARDVCSADVNSYKLCDMAGNVMEWVNDWYEPFADTTLTNYVGASDVGALGQRILKGGAYNKDPNTIQLSSRGDVYMVTSSMKSDYVGYRLAFGAIPSPSMGIEGNPVSSIVQIPVNSFQLKDFLGTYRAKLAFVNDETKNLSFVDFSAVPLMVSELVDTMAVYHPEISPDGKRVAFCTGLEGVSSASKVYVRNLSLVDPAIVELPVENAAIPRWRLLENGDTAIVYVSDAGNNKGESEWKQKSTWQVVFKNGAFESPTRLYEGSFHGGISEKARLAVSGSSLLRANVNGENQIWYNQEQACNVSLAKDSTKRSLFLDFASKTGEDFVGSKYAVHERLFIADSTGQLIQSIAAPSNYAFDHTEWTNKKDFAVTSLTNTKGAHPIISLLSIKDSRMIDLVEGAELWHPSFWVYPENTQMESELDADSAGVYLLPSSDLVMLTFRYKMELFWRHYDSVKTVVVGSSRPMSGVDPFAFDSSNFTINMAHTPNNIYLSRYIIQNYLLNHAHQLKNIVLSLDIDFWNKEEAPEWDAHYWPLPGVPYDKNHNFWKDGVPEKLLELVESSYGGNDENRNTYAYNRGILRINSGTWGEIAPVDADSNWIDVYFENYQKSFQCLKDIINMAANYNIRVIGVIFPQNPRYKETGSLGRYGFRRSVAAPLIEEIRNLENTHSNFYFMDENKMGDHDYADDMASDVDHLNYYGAQQMTERINALIQSLP